MGAHNNWPYIINLGNSIIGVAVLAMPFCFKQCGILLGMLVLLFCTWLTLASCQLLMKAGVTARRRSYEFLAYHTHGATGQLVSALGMIGMQLGTLIAQIVVIGDLGPAIISKVFGIQNTSGLRTFLICVLVLSVGLPLGLLKNLRAVSRASTVCISFYCVFVIYVSHLASTVCISFYCVFVIYVVYLSLPNLWSGVWYPNVHFWRPEGLFQCLPILSFSFGCQTQLFLLYDALPEPSLKAINGVISSAVNLCAVAYLLVGFFGYIAFYSYDIPGDVIAVFPSTYFAGMMKLCFVFSICITFPVIIFPCRASIYSLLFAQRTKPHEDAMEGDSYIPEKMFKLITVSIVLGSMITGILIPNVEFILGINGAITGTLICYIFPALFFMRVMGTKPDGRMMAQMVLFLGLTILLVSTYATLSSQDSHHNEAVDKLNKPGLDNLQHQDQLKPNIDVPQGVKDIDIIKQKDDGGVRREPPNPFPPESQGKERGPAVDIKNGSDKKIEPGKMDVTGGPAGIDQSKLSPTNNAKVIKLAEDKVKEMKEKEKEKKQEEFLAKLEHQQKEQAKLLQEQKIVLKELKDHHAQDAQIAHQEAEKKLHEQNQVAKVNAETNARIPSKVVDTKLSQQSGLHQEKASLNEKLPQIPAQPNQLPEHNQVPQQVGRALQQQGETPQKQPVQVGQQPIGFEHQPAGLVNQSAGLGQQSVMMEKQPAGVEQAPQNVNHVLQNGLQVDHKGVQLNQVQNPNPVHSREAERAPVENSPQGSVNLLKSPQK